MRVRNEETKEATDTDRSVPSVLTKAGTKPTLDGAGWKRDLLQDQKNDTTQKIDASVLRKAERGHELHCVLMGWR